MGSEKFATQAGNVAAAERVGGKNTGGKVAVRCWRGITPVGPVQVPGGGLIGVAVERTASIPQARRVKIMTPKKNKVFADLISNRHLYYYRFLFGIQKTETN
jgi:hypothetical protein